MSVDPHKPMRSVHFDGPSQGAVVGDDNEIVQHFYAAPVVRPTPREAPLQPASFTARDELVQTVVASLCADPGAPITVLCGMGGVGKTTLAAACATTPEAEAHFPDGTFWVDLQASDPLDTLAHIADAYGSDVRGCASVPSRAAAVRSVLSTKHTLIVLDDAWGLEEVTSLLPQTRSCRVLVTTRDEELASEISDSIVSVDVLDRDGSQELWQRLVGGGAGASHDLHELLDLLGGLPLALTLAGTRARKDLRRGPLRLADYVEELRRPAGIFSGDSRYERVGAAFRATYDRALDDDDRRRFRALATLEENELELAAIARAWALDSAAAFRELEGLADLSLVALRSDGRCRLHPLVRGFAASLLAQEPEAVRRELHERAADHFFEIASQPVLASESITALDAAVSSYVHAALAESKDRSDRIVPEFRGKHLRRTLIELGRGRSLVRMNTADFVAAESKGVIQRAWARWWLADALRTAGESQRCERELLACLAESVECSGQRPLLVRRAAFLLGHVLRERGSFSEAARSYEQAMAADCELSGKQIDPLTLLQIGDCHAQAGETSAAFEAFQRVHDFATQPGEGWSLMPVRALVRLADLYVSVSPGDALRYLDLAASYHEDQPPESSPFCDPDGARYMNWIASGYANLTMNTPIECEAKAARCFRRALAMAQTRPLVHADILRSLGDYLEHLDAIPLRPLRTPDLAAAVACQVRAAELLASVEGTVHNPPAEVLERRLRPRLSPSDFDAALANASRGAAEILDAALARLEAPAV